jgi:hypothetical protein
MMCIYRKEGVYLLVVYIQAVEPVGTFKASVDIDLLSPSGMLPTSPSRAGRVPANHCTGVYILNIPPRGKIRDNVMWGRYKKRGRE